jgi:hypothetical protein
MQSRYHLLKVLPVGIANPALPIERSASVDADQADWSAMYLRDPTIGNRASPKMA